MKGKIRQSQITRIRSTGTSIQNTESTVSISLKEISFWLGLSRIINFDLINLVLHRRKVDRQYVNLNGLLLIFGRW